MGPHGPFGLISEEFKDDNFRGFFTSDPDICIYALKMMGEKLDTEFDI